MTNNPDGLSDARAREVLQSLMPYRLQFENDPCADRYADNIPASIAIAAMLAYASSPEIPGNAVEAVARAMCDRVNGQGDYDGNIDQRRSGWMAQAKAGIAAYLATPPASTSTAIAENETLEQQWMRMFQGIRDSNVEPTEAMWEAAWEASLDYFVHDKVTKEGFRRGIQAMMAAAPKAASEDGVTGLLREALEQIAKAETQLGQATEYSRGWNDARFRMRHIAAAALAASPTDATGAERMREAAALLAESESARAAQNVDVGYRPAHNTGVKEAADRLARLIRNLPVAGETT